MAEKKKWIKGVVSHMHKGAFREEAQRHGESTHAYAEEHKHDQGTRGKRARLALALMGTHHGGHHEQQRPMSRAERRYGSTRQ